jgi:hypothetical protein
MEIETRGIQPVCLLVAIKEQTLLRPAILEV